METENRLSKVLARAGVASRRAAEELIFSGAVSLNGQVVRLPQTPACPERDVIKVHGRKIQSSEKKVYYVLNKPKGYICSNARVNDKKIVLDLFEGESERLFTVGRLDRDTTGLIIVTNDGHFANKVIHPSANLTKEYLVKTREEITHEQLTLIGKGTFVEGTFVRPKRVNKVRKGTVKITVSEGKKREVRLLVQNAGLSLYSLQRIRIGGLQLGKMPVGMWRAMSEDEKEQIFH